MTRIWLLILLLSICGCKTLDLDPKWAPLKHVKQSLTLSPSSTGARTIGDTVYVRNLSKWLDAHPEPLFTALLLHEQEHSKRQFAYDGGHWAWIGRYVTDTDFMWDEEQRGWYLQIKHARSRGAQIVVDKLAKSLSDYRNLAGSMVSESDARAWINAVLSGAWHPSDD